MEYFVSARITSVIEAEDEEEAIDEMRHKIANDVSKWDFVYEAKEMFDRKE